MNGNILLKAIFLLLMGIFIAGGAFAWDPAQQMAEQTEKFLSLNDSMKALVIDGWRMFTIVYNSRNYILNPKLFGDYSSDEKTFIIKQNDIDPDIYELPLIIGRSKSNPVKAKFWSGNLPPSDTLSIDAGKDEYNHTGQVICLHTESIVYVFSFTECWHSHIEPGIVIKYKISEKKFIPVAQPFYRMDLYTTLTTNAEIYSSVQQEEKTGLLAAGSEVHVIGYQRIMYDKWYLLEGKTGIIGWHKAVEVSNSYDSENGWTTIIYSLEFMNQHLPDAG